LPGFATDPIAAIRVTLCGARSEVIEVPFNAPCLEVPIFGWGGPQRRTFVRDGVEYIDGHATVRFAEVPNDSPPARKARKSAEPVAAKPGAFSDKLKAVLRG